MPLGQSEPVSDVPLVVQSFPWRCRAGALLYRGQYQMKRAGPFIASLVCFNFIITVAMVSRYDQECWRDDLRWCALNKTDNQMSSCWHGYQMTIPAGN